MKKFVLLLLLASCLSFVAQSQTAFAFTATNPTGAVLNATVDSINYTMSGRYTPTATIQYVLTKTSGTIVGTVKLYGSNYGTTGTWDNIDTTLTLTNATINKYTWTITPKYKYYLITQQGGTTMAGTLVARIYAPTP